MAFALAAAILPLPSPRPDRARGEPVLRHLWRSLGEGRMRGALWLVSLPALFGGTLAVIAPLRMSAVGLSVLAIAATWLEAAAVESVMNPLIGRWSDRAGRTAPLRLALTAALVCSLALAWIPERWALAAVVGLTAVAYGSIWVPAMTNLSEHADRVGLGQGAGFALQALWAPAHVFAAVVLGGAVAHWLGGTFAFVLLAVACLGTLTAAAGRELPRTSRLTTR